MTVPPLRIVGDEPPDPEPSGPFFLIVADHDRSVFAVEGPMIDDRPWKSAARHARDHLHRHCLWSNWPGSGRSRCRISTRQEIRWCPAGKHLAAAGPCANHKM
jgi:hypothetical protein